MQQMIKYANQIRFLHIYIYIYVYNIHTYAFICIHTHTHTLSLSLFIHVSTVYTYHNLVNIAKVSLWNQWNQLAAMGLSSTPWQWVFLEWGRFVTSLVSNDGLFCQQFLVMFLGHFASFIAKPLGFSWWKSTSKVWGWCSKSCTS